MAQILVTIDESITTNSIRHAIGMLKGVISTSLYNTEKKVSKKKAQETYVKDSLGRAFDEIKQKDSSNAKFQSLDDFLMECWYFDICCYGSDDKCIWRIQDTIQKLSKRYKSLKSDIQELSDELKANPDLGTELFHNVRKVRLSIKSKGKGKRGGARIITYKCNYHDNGKCEISLLTIYDKSEISSVSDKYIKYLINLFMSKR